MNPQIISYEKKMKKNSINKQHGKILVMQATVVWTRRLKPLFYNDWLLIGQKYENIWTWTCDMNGRSRSRSRSLVFYGYRE